MTFNDTFTAKVQHAENVIKKYLPKEEGYQKTVFEAMNYSVLSGGKRLRPVLMYASYELFNGKDETIYPFMAALEMIHTYSLIHDDLPAMDNDDYRRGRKTTHVVYGEAMAILAGDALLNYAFETAMKSFEMTPGNVACEKALQILGRKAGIYGMIGGQVADVEAEKKSLSLPMEALLYIHENKTAALLQAALTIGAVLAGANDEQIEMMEQIGLRVGVAFQIQDDILDVTGTMEELGKPIGSDEKNEKTTYVTMVGLEKAAKDVERLSKEAMDMLGSFEGDASFLEDMFAYLINRRN